MSRRSPSHECRQSDDITVTDASSRLRVRVIRALVAALPGKVGHTYRRNVVQLAIELEREHELRWRDVANCAAGGLRLYPRSMVNLTIALGITVVSMTTLARLTPSPSSTSSRPTYHSSPSVIAYSIPVSRLGSPGTTRGCHAVNGSTTVVFSTVTTSSRRPFTSAMRGACEPQLDEAGRSTG